MFLLECCQKPKNWPLHVILYPFFTMFWFLRICRISRLCTFGCCVSSYMLVIWRHLWQNFLKMRICCYFSGYMLCCPFLKGNSPMKLVKLKRFRAFPSVKRFNFSIKFYVLIVIFGALIQHHWSPSGSFHCSQSQWHQIFIWLWSLLLDIRYTFFIIILPASFIQTITVDIFII